MRFASSVLHLTSTAICLILSMPVAASAQMAASDEVGSDSLPDIVVTAQKRDQSLQDVPISVSVVGEQTIRLANIKAASELPNISPALTYTSGAVPSFASFNIRGIGSYVYRIGVQPAVSVVVDGVPLARTAEFAGALGDIERAEVLSGPQGTLFGRNATGGAINIVRKGPTDRYEAYVDGELAFGTQGGVETVVKGMLNMPLSQDIALRLFAYNRQNSDYLKNYNPDASDAGKHRVSGFQAKLKIDFSPDLDLLLSGDYAHDYSRIGTASIFIPLQDYQQPRIPNVTAVQSALLGASLGDPFAIYTYRPYYTIMDFGGGTADLTWKPMSSLRIKSITSYRKAALDNFSPLYNVSVLNPVFDLLSLSASAFSSRDYIRVTRWHYFTQELRAEYTSDLIDATAGGYYTNLKETELSDNPFYLSARSLGLASGTPTGPSTQFPYYYFNNLTDSADRNRVLAGFVDVTLHPAPGLDLFGGYRLSRESLEFRYRRNSFSTLPVQFGTNFDRATWTPTVAPATTGNLGSKRTETLWAGRAGLSYEITRDLHSYGTFSRGYIGSGVDLGNGSVATRANPDVAFLRPSIAKNYELGLKTQLFDRRLRLNIAFFKTKTKDVQVTALIPGTSTNIVQNAGDIDAKGVEINMEAQPVEALNLSGGFSYLDAKIRNLSQRCYPNQAKEEGSATRCINGRQSVAGLPAINSPKYKFNMAATYTIGLDETFDAYLRADFQYRSKAWFQLDHDPLATQDAYGILNLAMGLTSTDKRYDIRFYVSNVTDKFFCHNMVNGPTFRQGCQSTPIDAQRRFGVAARAAF